MINISIVAAFDRMWQHIMSHLDNKSNINHTHSAQDIVSDVLPVSNGGTGCDSLADTTYITARYRGSSLNSTETNPSINGTISWTYE